ncbi:hypothetical protein CDQ84_06635 [Clostridium thermosuccinogenes]|jgi:hypothetical protein|uniref:Uncharacterized protein n=1 Tax=Clostridium thermosuccinogenes TaxID=84032 RepID=A0A2K2FNJ9_9CLOT|nr:hypothetical protein [Pseudoclostridium thermosuccinogenes]AUS97446.1 hypothetical protein CDO33_13955 [Pseudoclostridium thermosuccinogenes]PNT98203.1 hypothetical protein CDQ85_06135 [Pseudoclostridium thermosuccinogenes]PNU00353.1 hypothetical protein CDQ84_06635 [Pseudoclostridium thermosuccinogenes]
MDDEKRMVDTYEIKHAIHIGDKEILFGVDERKSDCPYMVCNCSWDNPLGIEHYFNAMGSADYLEMMTEFTSRVTAQLEAVIAERTKITVPMQPFKLEHCIPIDSMQNLENKVVIINPERLRPEYRTADKQLVLVTGGFGAHANSRGRAVYTTNLYSGKESRWNREDILGVVRPEYMPDWAKERLAQIQSERHLKQKKQEIER